jgi:hypothetical protein
MRPSASMRRTRAPRCPAEVARRHHALSVQDAAPRLGHYVLRHDDEAGATPDMLVDGTIDRVALPQREYDPVRWYDDPPANRDATDSKRPEQIWKAV